jgi:hypothetical protein
VNSHAATPFRRLAHWAVGVVRAFTRLFLAATPEVRSVDNHDNHASTLYRELRAKASTAPLSELL